MPNRISDEAEHASWCKSEGKPGIVKSLAGNTLAGHAGECANSGDPSSKLPIAGSVSPIWNCITPLTNGFDSSIANERRGVIESSRTGSSASITSPGHERLCNGDEGATRDPAVASEVKPALASPKERSGEDKRAGLCKGEGEPGLLAAKADAAESVQEGLLTDDGESGEETPSAGIDKPEQPAPEAGTEALG